MARRKRRANSPTEQEVARPQRRTKRLMRRLVLLLAVVAALVAAAPTLVSYTTLHNSLLADQLPQGWQIRSEQVSLGWLSYQSLTSISLHDEQGNLLLTAESAAEPKSLISLAIDSSDLGTIKLHKPVVYLHTRPDGSNWEDFLEALLAEPSSGAEFKLSIEVTEGTVQAVDQHSGQQWILDQLNTIVSLGSTVEASGSARLATQTGPQTGTVKFQMAPTENGWQQLELLADRLPLSPLAPWLARVAPGAELMGACSADAQVLWLVDPEHGLAVRSTGRIEASQVLASVNALQGDQFRCQKLTAPWQCELSGNQLTINELDVTSDWGRLQAAGVATLDELTSLGTSQLPSQAVRVSGEFDLAQLANMFPRTLQLKPDVRIDAGELTFAIGTPAGEQQSGWQAQLIVKNVAGTNGTRQIRWEQPIEATATVQDSPAGPWVEELTVSAPFADASVQSRDEAWLGTFSVDLDRLTQELSQFIEWGDWQLRGLGEGTFEFTRQQGQTFTANSAIDCTDLTIAGGGQSYWTEPKLHLELQVAGDYQQGTPQTIRTGSVQLRGPRDQLELVLLEPHSWNALQQPWHVQVQATSPVQLWRKRLQTLLPPIAADVQGDAHLQAKLKITEDTLQVADAKGSVVGLRVQGEGIAIDEPRVEFSGGARWDRTTGRIQTDEVQLLGSSLSVRASDVAIALNQQTGYEARGKISFRADLQRLSAMAGSAEQSIVPRGAAVGQLQLATDAEAIRAEFGMTVENLELARLSMASGAAYGQPEIVWREPQLEATGVAKYEIATDQAELENLQIVGKTLRLNSSAHVAQLRTTGALEATGLLEYDSAELAKLISSYTGPGVQLTGDRQVRFQVAGNLYSAEAEPSSAWEHQWQATAEAGWTSAGAYGLTIGGGRLQGTLRDGYLRIAPLDVAVGQGRLTAEPLVRLTSAARQVVLPRGPLISNVAISPEVSETMLKYVAPILAGATRTEGQFSIDLELAEVPLDEPRQARVQGRLTAHRLSVAPGPMVAQLTTLVKQVESLLKHKQLLQALAAPSSNNFLTMTDQQIEFQVVDGRVYHRNLEFLVDGVPVRSYGSVGFDQTLALMIEIPFQEKWISSEPSLRGFAGQVLQIPVQGTFDKPRIDERAVANLSTQLLQGAAQQAIGDELNRQLEKLFRGK